MSSEVEQNLEGLRKMWFVDSNLLPNLEILYSFEWISSRIVVGVFLTTLNTGKTRLEFLTYWNTACYVVQESIL